MGVYSSNSYYGYSNPTYRENEGNFIFSNPDFNQISALDFTNKSPLNISDISSVYDYYLAFSCFADATNTGYDVDISKFTFFPTSFSFNARNHDNSLSNLVNGDISYYHLDGFTYLGFAVSCKLDLSNFSDGYYIFISGNGSIPAHMVAQGQVIAVPKGLANGDVNQAIVQAINNQTSILDGSIGQAADDIQQSIEDQYSGDPETEFSVDDVITQHNEKMGVLSFGSDVMLQFLDMFQSANVGTAQLTLPGFNITVENVEYSVWPDYSFNFEQLNEWVPALMSVIRVMLPAFVWLMVLRYCINVFEKNFLSNGG